MDNHDEFLREITLRICSSLEIRESLRSAFDYLREHFPIDTLTLFIIDDRLGAAHRLQNGLCFRSTTKTQHLHLRKARPMVDFEGGCAGFPLISMGLSFTWCSLRTVKILRGAKIKSEHFWVFLGILGIYCAIASGADGRRLMNHTRRAHAVCRFTTSL